MTPPTRRQFLGMLAAGTGGALLGGCGVPSGPVPRDVPLRVAGVNHVWTRAIVERLPEIEEFLGRPVSISLLTGDQLASTYNVRLNASGADIDVMMVRPLQEQRLFTRNSWLADLTDRVTGDPGFRWDDIQDAPREACTVDGRVMSVPVVTERPVLYYRRDLGPPPATLDELLANARRLHDPAAGMYGAVGRGRRAAAVTQFSSFLYSHGGDFVTEDGRSAIGTPEATAAYRFYGELLGRNGPPGVANMDLDQALPVFAQGRAAYYTDADAVASSLLDPESSAVLDTIGFAPFPAGPAGSRPFNVPSWALGINRFSRMPDEAWRFVQWAAGPATATDIQTGGIPGARQAVWDDPATLAGFPPELAETMQINTRNGIGYDRPQVLQVGRARDIVGGPLVAAIVGADVPAAVREADGAFADFLVRDSLHQEVG